MPFDFDSFRRWCTTLSDDLLRNYYQKYVRQIAQCRTGRLVGYGLAVFTCGITLIGSASSAAEMANAAAKAEIFKDEMIRRQRKPVLNTHMREVRGAACGSNILITTVASRMVGHSISATASSAIPR